MAEFNPFSIDDDSENDAEFSQSIPTQDFLTNELNGLLNKGLASIDDEPFKKASSENLSLEENKAFAEKNEKIHSTQLPTSISSFSQSMFHKPLKDTDIDTIFDANLLSSNVKFSKNDVNISRTKAYTHLSTSDEEEYVLSTDRNAADLAPIDILITEDSIPIAVKKNVTGSENICLLSSGIDLSPSNEALNDNVLPRTISDNVLPSLSSSILLSTPQRTATLSNGKVVHIKRKFKNKSQLSSENEEILPNRENNFGVPVNSLLSSIEADKVIQANQPKSVDLPKATLKGTLWTEKWRPKSWIDLIGNERTHRQLLAWLKTWSKCVFNEESIHDGTEFDPLGRPERKILLIHGPPGIGKTTIAHVIARQAGYEVLEINASDERGGTLVKEKIIGATESHRVDDNKPVCIIADEIEGSSEAGFIRILVDMINSDKKACEHLRNNVKTFKSNKERKKKKSSLLLRPIIAICNDVYANSLRNLRPLAEVIQYKRVPPSMMITKLKQICSLEKVVVDTKKLTEVVNQVEGDMRSALNILQFGKSKSNSSEKKDINVGWSNIVNRVFHRGSGISREDETSKILATVDMCGEYDKLVSGCFSLYPEMQYHDDMVLKPGKIGDWLFFFDELNKGVYQSQHHQLEEYFSQAVLAFYSFFSSTTNVHNMRPKSDFEHFQAKNASMEFITQLLNDVPARISQMFKKADVPMELAPYLMRILSPNVQPVNMALVKTIEKEQMANSAAVAFSLNIRLLKDKIDSANIYRLEPPLELLAHFGEEAQNTSTIGKFSVRQLLAQEIYQERLRKAKREYDEINGIIDGNTMKNTKSKKIKLTIENIPLGKKDFFGRIIATDTDNNNKTRESSPAGSTGSLSRVWIQYNEGFSNAVRKNITWDELWAM